MYHFCGHSNHNSRPTLLNYHLIGIDFLKLVYSAIFFGLGHTSVPYKLSYYYFCYFSVDVKDAGEGSLEISIQGPNGQMIENSVAAYGRVPGVFQVSCVPVMAGPHRANVLFNCSNVTGKSISFGLEIGTNCF